LPSGFLLHRSRHDNNDKDASMSMSLDHHQEKRKFYSLTMDSREDSIIELFLRLPTIIDYWLNPDVATFDIYIDP
jgi:hypothetical protein